MTKATGRPVPQPSLASREYWASGSDGVLRVQRCADCGSYQMPPMPRCRSCRGEKVSFTPVSGTGTVIGVSVNHQQWLPSLPPPYTIANVALDEDDGCRITTNVVNCPPSDVRVGTRVRVLFEELDDGIWLPLFEPVPLAEGGGDDGPQPEIRDYRAALRAPASARKPEDEVALTGVGQSRVGRRLMTDPIALTIEATLSAIEDAGLTLADIDGICSYPGNLPHGMSEGGISALVEALQLTPTWINGGGETPGQIGSIMNAMMAVASGMARHVLCFRTVWQATHAELARSGFWKESSGRAEGVMSEYRLPYGAVSASSWIGMAASQYLHRYGRTREEVLAPVALTARANAAANPEAVYRDPLTLDDYVNARMVSTPFGLYDCDVPVDGAVAIIVSAKETVGDLRSTPVYVEAIGTQIMERLSWDQDTFTHLPQTLGPAAHLWSRTDLTPDDIDIAELYDGFTFNAVSWFEALGFCGFGEAADFFEGGKAIAIDGRLPLNTHGGQLSAGRLHGYGFVREAMLQLRGEAPGLQVPHARTAVVSAGGGVPSGAMLLRRD